ncbi:hypothetical protein H8B02_37875 [Bradyrhizobium sp. Pear77]|uniref:hypothetical protein n=1 Tax=Bradyrhizobium TaxID=374 RepID=UPI001E2888A8|nr:MULTISPECIES: hypothetical protein [Bradyrhizobium]MCC8958983.1 hypothetical protein [Bradyrhizobium altum]MCC8967561.1 hypothetical protein [Bradyrhizobium oropedii]
MTTRWAEPAGRAHQRGQSAASWPLWNDRIAVIGKTVYRGLAALKLTLLHPECAKERVIPVLAAIEASAGKLGAELWSGADRLDEMLLVGAGKWRIMTVFLSSG